MLTFLSPSLLLPAAALAALALVALLRGSRSRHRISSTLLWHNLSAHAAGHKKRFADPLWLLLFLATALAALAAANPLWQPAIPAAPALSLTASLRALSSADHAELFLRTSGPLTPDSLQITSDSASPTRLLLQPQIATTGITLPIPKSPHLSLTLLSAGNPVAAADLSQRSTPDLLLRTLGPVPNSLLRVFQLQPHLTTTPSPTAIQILLISTPPAATQPRLRLPQHDALILFVDSAIPPNLGLTPGTLLTPASPLPISPASATPFTTDQNHPLPFNATVSQIRQLQSTPDWQPLLLAGNLPLVLLRRNTSDNLTYIYLSTNLAPAQTQWPLDISFPIFFTKLAESMRPGNTPADLQQWTTTLTPPPAPPQRSPLPITPWLLALSLVLIILTVLALFRRTQMK